MVAFTKPADRCLSADHRQSLTPGQVRADWRSDKIDGAAASRPPAEQSSPSATTGRLRIDRSAAAGLASGPPKRTGADGVGTRQSATRTRGGCVEPEAAWQRGRRIVAHQGGPEQTRFFTFMASLIAMQETIRSGWVAPAPAVRQAHQVRGVPVDGPRIRAAIWARDPQGALRARNPQT